MSVDGVGIQWFMVYYQSFWGQLGDNPLAPRFYGLFYRGNKFSHFTTNTFLYFLKKITEHRKKLTSQFKLCSKNKTKKNVDKGNQVESSKWSDFENTCKRPRQYHNQLGSLWSEDLVYEARVFAYFCNDGKQNFEYTFFPIMIANHLLKRGLQLQELSNKKTCL